MWEERKGILKDLHLLQIMSFIFKISKVEEFIKRQYLNKLGYMILHGRLEKMLA